MTYARFFTLLALFTAIAALCAVAAHYFLPIGYALPLTVGTIFFFIGVCSVMFYFGKRTAGADNKMLFTNVFMGLTMAKMFLSGAAIGVYAYLARPDSKLFIIPFFVSYVIYTVLEIMFLFRLARITSPLIEKEEAMSS